MTSQTPPRPERVGRTRGGWTVFTVRGVPVRVDASWFLIAGLATYLFYSRMQVSLAGTSTTIILLAAVAAAALFFASLLAHEFGHAFTSLDRGLPVIGITLFLMGGVTESTKEASRARDEFIIVGAGPFVSLVLAASFALLHTAVDPSQPFAAIAGYLAWTNLLLAVFNLVPGYPLDGGRLLRSILWGLTKRKHASTRWAARVGQLFAVLLLGYGGWLLVGRGFGGIGGLWEIVLGFFLFRGAAEAHTRARIQERLAGTTARQLMGSVPPPLDAHLPLSTAIGALQERPSVLWPVGAPLVGTVSLADIDAVPSASWETTTLAQVAHSPERSTIAADALLDDVLQRIVGAPQQMLVVVDSGRPVGLLTPSLVLAPDGT